MFVKLLLAMLVTMSLVSCSGSKSAEEVNDTEGIELVDGEDDLLEVDERTLLDDDSGVSLDDSEIEGIDSIALDDVGTAEQDLSLIEGQPIEPVPYEEGEEFNQQVDIGVGVDTASAYVDRSGGATASYQVEKNETLMLIAFKLYGDYSRWRELADLNAGKLGPGNQVMAGSTIQYYTDGSGFSFNPAGEAYLIKQRDTLSKISNKVYGTYNKWRAIWDNNRPLIKNPDLIFAGFTIYYPVGGN